MSEDKMGCFLRGMYMGMDSFTTKKNKTVRVVGVKTGKFDILRVMLPDNVDVPAKEGQNIELPVRVGVYNGDASYFYDNGTREFCSTN